MAGIGAGCGRTEVHEPHPGCDGEARKQNCWMCDGLGGVSIHQKASRETGRPLWVAHTLESGSHPVNPCPVCYATELTKHTQAAGQFLVDFMDKQGWLPEHCFTFPDGETWWATGHESHV